MHNIEMVDVKDIRQLILDLRVLHAAQFNKNFPLTGPSAMPMEKVEEIALEALIGVTKHQFDKASARLKTSGSKFMPSFSEFREWCIGASWMSADEAWSRACKWQYLKIVLATVESIGTAESWKSVLMNLLSITVMLKTNLIYWLWHWPD